MSAAEGENANCNEDELAVTQTIFVGVESSSSCSEEREVSARNVVVESAAGAHTHGSSKVKFKNIVDYNWESKWLHGNLLAVHVDGKFIAYSIKGAAANSTAGKTNGMVRITHVVTQKRALIKGMVGCVKDLAFAYVASPVLLACVDESGNVFVHKIASDSDAISQSLVLRLSISSDSFGKDHRVLWCPYIPDADEDEVEIDSEDDCAKLLLVTDENKAYIWNVGVIADRYGSANLKLSDIAGSYLSIEDHTQSIVDAAFSPDGTSLATASLDGFVMFFQIYINFEPPRCLYRWTPHDGKPLSSIFFLDNRNSTEQFWKFVVTGAEKNSVLKIWSCQSWECLQTIIFAPSPKYSIELKAGLDQSAKYLLLSDIERRVLFVLHLDHTCENMKAVYCKKISEFYLPHSILCFGIVDATMRRQKSLSSCSDAYHSPTNSLDELKDGEEIGLDGDLISNGYNIDIDDGSDVRGVIRLYLVQPTKLQEGQVTFSPIGFSMSNKTSDISFMNDTIDYKEGLVDTTQDQETSVITNSSMMSFSDKEENPVLLQQSQQLKNLLMRSQIGPNNFIKQPTSPIVSGSLSNMSFAPLLTTSVAVSTIQQPINLMTPDAFSSAKLEETDISKSDSSICIPSLVDEEFFIPAESVKNLNQDSLNNHSQGYNQTQSNTVDKFASGGSSPSREVQEILSLQGSDYKGSGYFNDFEEDGKEATPILEQSPSNKLNHGIQQTFQEGFQAFNANDDYPRINHLLLHNSSKLPTSKSDTQNMGWPSIDLAKINEANQRKSTNDNDKSSTHSMSNSITVSTIIDLTDDSETKNGEKQTKKSPVQSTGVEILSNQVEKLIVLVHDQQKELSILKGEIGTFRRIYQNNSSSNVDKDSLAAMIDQAIQINQVQSNKIVQAAIDKKVETDRINRESLLSGISQIMGGQIAEKLNSAVAHETLNNIIPMMERLIDPMIRSMQLEVSKKLTATDHLLSDNIQKLVTSKSITDNLCVAISHSVATSTKEAFKQTIQTSLIPHLEKAQSQMFKQLNQSFNSGTKEYLSAFEGCTKRILDYTSTVDDTLSKVKTIIPQLQVILDQQTKHSSSNLSMNHSIKQLNNLIKELQSVISHSLQGAIENQMTPLKECIKEQISTGMAAQAAQLEDCVLSAVRSGTQTPAPSVIDMQFQQSHIDNLLSTGQINSAFQYALSASDLKLVVYACNIADPKQVFTSPCSLQPNVLLSLIQQLSADMTSDTQLKCSYLGEAVMYLDSDNPLTKEHMPVVLMELRKQLKHFLLNNPHNTSSGQLKLLLMATESLLKP